MGIINIDLGGRFVAGGVLCHPLQPEEYLKTCLGKDLDAGRSYGSLAMEHITVEKIIEIHDEVILNYEGTSGILSESTLHYLVYRLNRNRSVIRRAALALHAIGSQHPFIDGNKRTALIVAENILGQDGLYLAAGEDQIVKFMVGVASYETGPGDIEVWIRNHAEKME